MRSTALPAETRPFPLVREGGPRASEGRMRGVAHGATACDNAIAGRLASLAPLIRHASHDTFPPQGGKGRLFDPAR